MSKFRKKQVVVEAIQWTGNNFEELIDFAGEDNLGVDPTGGVQIWVAANYIWAPITEGEWVLRDSKGIYPCLNDIFEQTYEPVDD